MREIDCARRVRIERAGFLRAALYRERHGVGHDRPQAALARHLRHNANRRAHLLRRLIGGKMIFRVAVVRKQNPACAQRGGLIHNFTHPFKFRILLFRHVADEREMRIMIHQRREINDHVQMPPPEPAAGLFRLPHADIADVACVQFHALKILVQHRQIHQFFNQHPLWPQRNIRVSAQIAHLYLRRARHTLRLVFDFPHGDLTRTDIILPIRLFCKRRVRIAVHRPVAGRMRIDVRNLDLAAAQLAPAEQLDMIRFRRQRIVDDRHGQRVFPAEIDNRLQRRILHARKQLLVKQLRQQCLDAFEQIVTFRNRSVFYVAHRRKIRLLVHPVRRKDENRAPLAQPARNDQRRAVLQPGNRLNILVQLGRRVNGQRLLAEAPRAKADARVPDAFAVSKALRAEKRSRVLPPFNLPRESEQRSALTRKRFELVDLLAVRLVPAGEDGHVILSKRLGAHIGHQHVHGFAVRRWREEAALVEEEPGILVAGIEHRKQRVQLIIGHRVGQLSPGAINVPRVEVARRAPAVSAVENDRNGRVHRPRVAARFHKLHAVRLQPPDRRKHRVIAREKALVRIRLVRFERNARVHLFHIFARGHQTRFIAQHIRIIQIFDIQQPAQQRKARSRVRTVAVALLVHLRAFDIIAFPAEAIIHRGVSEPQQAVLLARAANDRIPQVRVRQRLRGLCAEHKAVVFAREEMHVVQRGQRRRRVLQLRAHFVEKLIEAALLKIAVLPGGALRARIRADIAAVLFAVIVADKAIAEHLGKELMLRVRNGILAPVQPLFIRAGHEPPQVEHIPAAPLDRAQEFF